MILSYHGVFVVVVAVVDEDMVVVTEVVYSNMSIAYTKLDQIE